MCECALCYGSLEVKIGIRKPIRCIQIRADVFCYTTVTNVRISMLLFYRDFVWFFILGYFNFVMQDHHTTNFSF